MTTQNTEALDKVIANMEKDIPDWDELSFHAEIKNTDTLTIKTSHEREYHGVTNEITFKGDAPYNYSQNLFDDLDAMRAERDSLVADIPNHEPDAEEIVESTNPYKTFYRKNHAYDFKELENPVSEQHTCSSCNGAKKHTCSTCKGDKKVSCSCGNGVVSCGCGNGVVSCGCGNGLMHCYNCSGGQTSCHSCGRTGRIQGSWNNQTNSYDYHTCNRCGGSGTLSCNICYGKGYLNCNHCGGSAKLICSRCNGSAKLICSRCNGSAEVGCSTCNSYGYLTCDTCNAQGFKTIVHKVFGRASVIEDSKQIKWSLDNESTSKDLDYFKKFINQSTLCEAGSRGIGAAEMSYDGYKEGKLSFSSVDYITVQEIVVIIKSALSDRTGVFSIFAFIDGRDRILFDDTFNYPKDFYNKELEEVYKTKSFKEKLEWKYISDQILSERLEHKCKIDFGNEYKKMMDLPFLKILGKKVLWFVFGFLTLAGIFNGLLSQLSDFLVSMDFYQVLFVIVLYAITGFFRSFYGVKIFGWRRAWEKLTEPLRPKIKRLVKWLFIFSCITVPYVALCVLGIIDEFVLSGIKEFIHVYIYNNEQLITITLQKHVLLFFLLVLLLKNLIHKWRWEAKTGKKSTMSYFSSGLLGICIIIFVVTYLTGIVDYYSILTELVKTYGNAHHFLVLLGIVNDNTSGIWNEFNPKGWMLHVAFALTFIMMAKRELEGSFKENRGKILRREMGYRLKDKENIYNKLLPLFEGMDIGNKKREMFRLKALVLAYATLMLLVPALLHNQTTPVLSTLVHNGIQSSINVAKASQLASLALFDIDEGSDYYPSATDKIHKAQKLAKDDAYVLRVKNQLTARILMQFNKDKRFSFYGAEIHSLAWYQDIAKRDPANTKISSVLKR